MVNRLRLRLRLWIRHGLAAGVVGLALTCAAAWAERAEHSAAAEPVEIRATRIASFEKTNAARRRFGRLEFRGGLVLRSDNEKFGGFSDLVVAADGRRFSAVSDGGIWMAGEIVYEGTTPVALAHARIGPLLAMSGRVLDKKHNHDAEGMALLDGDLTRGTLLIAFERNRRIGRFPVRDGAVLAPTGYIKLPAATRQMKSNKGLEAVTLLRAGPHRGSLLAIAERLADTDDNHTGWLGIGNAARRISIRNAGAFDITGAAALADGAVIILERYFRWTDGVRMRLRYLTPAALASGAPIDGETLLEADMGYEIDNMEGVAVHEGESGESVLTLVSDDNFNTFLQRTLLLQFTLPAKGSVDAGAR